MRSLLLATVTATIALSLNACAAKRPADATDEVPVTDDEAAPESPAAKKTKKDKMTPQAEAPATPAAPAPVEAGDDDDDAPVTPVSTDVCAGGGTPIYAFENETGAWRYSSDPSCPPGFTPHGIAFRTAPHDTSKPTTPVYLLKNEANGDYMVSTVQNEGIHFGYSPVVALGHVFLESFDGTTPLVRYLQEVPNLRHRVSIDGQPLGWSVEPPRGFVCPR